MRRRRHAYSAAGGQYLSLHLAIITDERVYGRALSGQEQAVLDSMKQTIADRDGFTPVMLAADHDLVGIVTVHDGPSLPPGEIIAPEVGTDLHDASTFHNNFQEPELKEEAPKPPRRGNGP